MYRDTRVLLGGDDNVHFDVKTLAIRLQEPAIRDYLEAAGWNVNAIVDSLYRAPVNVWGPGDPRPIDVNTDLFPKDEFYLNNVSMR
jgi:spermidine synthase